MRVVACASDPESMPLRELLALEPGAQESLLGLGLGYSESVGHPALREAIGGLYRTSPQVVAFAGAQEPIYAFMQAVLQPGDGLIVHRPAYQSLYSLAEDRGLEVTAWNARPESRWQLDPDELPKLLSPATRAIVINSPHNPTGAVLERERFDATVAFARKHGLWLFSDEVYRGLEHDPAHRNPAACEVYEQAISLGAMAKVYGLAGLRIGWVATHDTAALHRMAAFKDFLSICNPGPSELLAALALRQAPVLAQRSRELVLENLALARALFAEHPEALEWVEPRGGTMGFPRLERGPSTPWIEGLLGATGVLLLPGALFDFDDHHFRLGLGRRNFPLALDGLRTWLRAGNLG